MQKSVRMRVISVAGLPVLSIAIKRFVSAALLSVSVLVCNASASAETLPDLDGHTVVVVTENAYPPLQFVDPSSGEAIGWEYDAIRELAERLNFELQIENTSWDAMIAAVSEGQFDVGMTGITIRDDRREKVDFSEAYMRSEMFMLVRADEKRFSSAEEFAAIEDGLIGAQAGTTPFYTAVYEVLGRRRGQPTHPAFSRHLAHPFRHYAPETLIWY